MSPAQLVRPVPIQSSNAHPEKEKELCEKDEPGRRRARAVRVAPAKEATARELVERGVFGGQDGRVGRDRDDATCVCVGGEEMGSKEREAKTQLVCVKYLACQRGHT